MTKVKQVLLGLLALLVLAMGALYLVPLGSYLPKVEQLLTKQLQTPVKIVALSLAALPLPHLEVHGVQVGQGINVQTIAVTPDFFSLLAGHPEVSQIRVSHASIDYLALQKLIAIQQATPSTGKSKVTLREFSASDVTLITPWVTLPDVEMQVKFLADGKLEKIWASLDKQHLTATLLPQADRHFSVQVAGQAWTVPLFPRIVLDKVQIAGVVSDRDFVAQKMTAAVGDMQFAASGSLDFGRAFKVAAQLEQLDVPLEQIAKWLEKPLEMKGALQIKGKVEGNGASFADLKNRALFTGDVSGKQLQVRLVHDAEQLLLMDDLAAHLVAQGTQIDVSALQASLYSGKLAGRVGLSSATGLMQSDLAISEVEMLPFVSALTNQILFSGNLNGNAKINLPLHELASFPKNVRIDGDFKMKKGVLSKVDLVKAATIVKDKSDSKHDKPATTEFDEFTGVAQVDSGGYHFSQLNLSSGVLTAQGKLSVTPDMKLSGDLDADLKGTLGIVSVPLVVAGSIDKPTVLPNSGFMAGAAVGTAVLPGIGTVVGMKIGGFLNKMFKDDHTAAHSAVRAR